MNFLFDMYIIGVVICLGMIASDKKESEFKRGYYFVALLSWFMVGFSLGYVINIIETQFKEKQL